VDNAGYDLTPVLPDLRRNDELDEKKLGAVAGGTSTFSLWARNAASAACSRQDWHLPNKKRPSRAFFVTQPGWHGYGIALTR